MIFFFWVWEVVSKNIVRKCHNNLKCSRSYINLAIVGHYMIYINYDISIHVFEQIMTILSVKDVRTVC